MFKNLLLACAAVVALGQFSGVASAATVTTVGADATMVAALRDTSLALPEGARWQVQPPTRTGSESPFSALGTAAASQISYYILPYNRSADLRFSEVQNNLTFLWGTPDTFNYVRFYLTGTAGAVLDISRGNLDIAGTQGTRSKLVTISDLLFDRVVFSSGGQSFEFASISVAPDVAPVPVPAAGLLLISALGGVAVLRRTKKSA